MQLHLKRDEKGADYTYGKLYVDGKYFCETIEDEIRAVKIKGESAIATGVYKVIINMSTRFKQMMPLLLNVQNFDGVRIHPGNTDDDTDGCIIVGESRGKIGNNPAVLNSRKVYVKLFEMMKKEKYLSIKIE